MVFLKVFPKIKTSVLRMAINLAGRTDDSKRMKTVDR